MITEIASKFAKDIVFYTFLVIVFSFTVYFGYNFFRSKIKKQHEKILQQQSLRHGEVPYHIGE